MEHDALNDIPWTVLFVTVVFIALSVVVLYYLNASYRREKQCRVTQELYKKLSKKTKTDKDTTDENKADTVETSEEI